MFPTNPRYFNQLSFSQDRPYPRIAIIGVLALGALLCLSLTIHPAFYAASALGGIGLGGFVSSKIKLQKGELGINDGKGYLDPQTPTDDQLRDNPDLNPSQYILGPIELGLAQPDLDESRETLTFGNKEYRKTKDQFWECDGFTYILGSEDQLFLMHGGALYTLADDKIHLHIYKQPNEQFLPLNGYLFKKGRDPHIYTLNSITYKIENNILQVKVGESFVSQQTDGTFNVQGKIYKILQSGFLVEQGLNGPLKREPHDTYQIFSKEEIWDEIDCEDRFAAELPTFFDCDDDSRSSNS